MKEIFSDNLRLQLTSVLKPMLQENNAILPKDKMPHRIALIYLCPSTHYTNGLSNFVLKEHI